MFGRLRAELEQVAERFDPALVDAATASAELDDVGATGSMARVGGICT